MIRRLGKTAFLPSLTTISSRGRRGLTGEPWVHPCSPARLPIPPLRLRTKTSGASDLLLPAVVLDTWAHGSRARPRAGGVFRNDETRATEEEV